MQRARLSRRGSTPPSVLAAQDAAVHTVVTQPVRGLATGQPPSEAVVVPSSFDLGHILRRNASHILAPLVNTGSDGTPARLETVLTCATHELDADAQHHQPTPAAVDVTICQQEPGQPLLITGLPARSTDPLQQRRRTDLGQQIWTLLGLDEDLSLFYVMAGSDARLAWVVPIDAGRTVRSPSVWEDMVKSILRTRLSAQRVGLACQRVCEEFGVRAASRRAAFPSAQALAHAEPARLAAALGDARVAATVGRLAHVCAHSGLYPESLRRLPSDLHLLIEDEPALLDTVEAELAWQDRIESLCHALPGLGGAGSALFLSLLGCYGTPIDQARLLNTWLADAPQAPARRRPRADVAKLVHKAQRAAQPYSMYFSLALRLLLQGE